MWLKRGVLVAVACVSSVSCGDNLHAPAEVDAAVEGVDAGLQCQPVQGEPNLMLELVAQGFDRPVGIAAVPGSDRLLILEQHSGKARLVEGDTILGDDFFRIADVAQGFEQGLLSVAFHPGYADNGRFFVSYSASDNTVTIEEWAVSSDPARADSSSRRVILEVPHPNTIHNGGRMNFGSDGYLYIGFGDGGPQHDPDGHAQDLAFLLGKFVRIDVDTFDSELAYGIPADNPFVDSPGARGEIYALGVRNPWAWSFDNATGHLFFGDVGLADVEEIDVLPYGSGAGGNFGWNILHGKDTCSEPGCDPDLFVPPIYEYDHESLVQCAVIGGAVYRGCRMPGHHGKYFFSDFCAGWVRSFYWSEYSPDVGAVTQWPDLALTNVSAFGEGHDGEIYVLDWEVGQLFRIAPQVL